MNKQKSGEECKKTTTLEIIISNDRTYGLFDFPKDKIEIILLKICLKM